MHQSHDNETSKTVRVLSRREVAQGVVELELADQAGADLPAWEPGAHIDLELGPDLVRQYSLCGDPADPGRYRIAVLREPDSRGGSAAVHDRLHEGTELTIRGPRNHFPRVPATRYIFIAGGIGITPIMAMAAAADAQGADWILHYGGRRTDSMAYRDFLTDRHGERVVLRPQDTHGLLDLPEILGSPAEDTKVYCCGPEALLAAVEEHCRAWPSGALHVERFAPKPVEEPVFDGSFEVELAQTGTTVTVPPDRSILEVVEEAGVQVLSSCQEGTCGTCETPVVAGEIDHRDSLLTDEEKQESSTMFICVSRAACPKIVLDL